MKTIITDNSFDYMGKQIASGNNVIHSNLDFETFNDGWPNLFIDNVKEAVEHRDVTYIGDFSKPENLFINYSAIRGILDYYANKVRVIMPYFPVGTMERIDTKGQVATAKYFADIMSMLPGGREGKTSIHILDIHALVERFLFDSNKVNAEMHTAMSLLRDEIEGKVIVFPDEGAEKRFGKEFKENEKIVCSKIRSGVNRVVNIKEGNPEGKDVIIIDDLIQSGKTIIETSKLLKKLGANTVTSYATHGVFPNDSHIDLAQYVDKLLVTDSIPKNIERGAHIRNMETISIKTAVEKIIFRD